MVPCRPRSPRRWVYWLVLVVATPLFALEPSFSLVVIAVGLSGLAATWTILLVGFSAADMLRSWRGGVVDSRPKPGVEVGLSPGESRRGVG